MGIPGAAIGSTIGGVIGALVWYLISIYANLEIGWIAWGIGALVGFGAAKGAGGECSPATGALAVAVAVLSIVGAKYAVAVVGVAEVMAGSDAPIEGEYAISYMADDVVIEFEEEGRSMDWPDGAGYVIPTSEEHYPEDVWALAEERWNSLTSEEQQVLIQAWTEGRDEGQAAFAAQLRGEWFRGSFAAIDLLFFGLAVVTAFKIGAGTHAVRET